MELTNPLQAISRLRIFGVMPLPPPPLYVAHRDNFMFADNCKKQELDEFENKNVRIHQLKIILILVKSWVVQE
jgi:hypothetical protein